MLRIEVVTKFLSKLGMCLQFNLIRPGLFRVRVMSVGGHFCPWALSLDRDMLETGNLEQC